MCHQVVSLTAQVLEEAGFVTVVVGSARDIVEEIGAPRFVFTDLPLGIPFGEPDDAATQLATLRSALLLATSATAPQTTVHVPAPWTGDPAWRETYMPITEQS